MAKRKTIGSGKSKHFTGRKRIANKTRKFESRIKLLNLVAQEKIIESTKIGRKKEK